MEHRWGERLRVNLSVTVRDSNGWTAVARIRDVSISGAFLECHHKFGTATWVTINFGHGAEATGIEAFIARWTRDGLGIEWCDFAPRVVVELLRSGTAPGRRVANPKRRAPKIDMPVSPGVAAKASALHTGASAARGTTRRR